MNNSLRETVLPATHSPAPEDLLLEPMTDLRPKIDRILSYGYKDKLVCAQAVASDYDVGYFSFLHVRGVLMALTVLRSLCRMQ